MEIAPPLQFPNPQVFHCVIEIKRVMDHENRIVERPCIVSESGRYYEIGRFVRESIFGHVSHAYALVQASVGDILVRLEPATHVAIKVYLRSKLRELQGRTQENPFKEMAAMEFIRARGGHINFIQHIECCADLDRVYSMMEFCDGGELYDIVESTSLSEGVARFYFRQIVRGIQFLHNLPVCHRDLSLENVLVTNNGTCKIIDMGMCLLQARSNLTGKVLLMPNQIPCGKKNYIAPEVIENRNPFQPILSDIWAVGIMLFILVAGVPPVDYATRLDPRYQMICHGRLAVLLEQWGIVLSPQLVDLISGILRPIPEQRLSLEAILAHPWMQLSDELPPNVTPDGGGGNMIVNVV